MRRGTTPIHTFRPDADLSAATVLYITYQQRGETVLEKALEDVTVTEEAVTVALTQAETLLFTLAQPVRVQIRAGFSDGTRIASNILTVGVDEILKEGEI